MGDLLANPGIPHLYQSVLAGSQQGWEGLGRLLDIWHAIQILKLQALNLLFMKVLLSKCLHFSALDIQYLQTPIRIGYCDILRCIRMAVYQQWVFFGWLEQSGSQLELERVAWFFCVEVNVISHLPSIISSIPKYLNRLVLLFLGLIIWQLFYRLVWIHYF